MKSSNQGVFLSIKNLDTGRKSFYRTIGRHSSIRDFLIKNFSVYSPIEPWHKQQLAFNLGLVHSPSSNEDENRYGVCPHADHHENLSFAVRVTYKFVLFCNLFKPCNVCRIL